MSMVVPTAEPSDEALAARAADGDDRAFEDIVERYQGRLYRLACRLTSDTDAPDVLQETFLQVYRHLVFVSRRLAIRDLGLPHCHERGPHASPRPRSTAIRIT